MKTEEIIHILSLIEDDQNIEILYACEVGSRVWGFESKDSPHQIRFIYKKSNSGDYLSLKDLKQGIDFRGDGLDIIGWDLKKTLTFHYKSNSNLREMLISDIVYINKGILTIFDNLGEFDKSVLKNHYLSTALMQWKMYCGLEFKKSKTHKYLSVIRSILCWNLLNQDFYPPLNINDLITHESSNLTPDVKESITVLIKYQQNQCELTEDAIFILNNFILNSFKHMSKVKIENNKDFNLYDERFRELLLTR